MERGSKYKEIDDFSHIAGGSEEVLEQLRKSEGCLDLREMM